MDYISTWHHLLLQIIDIAILCVSGSDSFRICSVRDILHFL